MNKAPGITIHQNLFSTPGIAEGEFTFIPEKSTVYKETLL